MQKKFIVLEGLIEEYIKRPEPISSQYLQKKLTIPLSSATIRYYFKQLTQDGYLEKVHSSSGRVPTKISLKNYWRSRLKENALIHIDDVRKIQKSSQKASIFCEMSLYRDTKLVTVENFQGRFLVLVFENGEAVIEYNEKLEKILQKYRGNSSFAVAQMLSYLGMTRVAKKIKQTLLQEFQIFSLKEILEIAREDSNWANRNFVSLMDGEMLQTEKPGLKLYNDFLSYKFSVEIDEKLKGEMLLFGHLYRNYTAFINTLRKE